MNEQLARSLFMDYLYDEIEETDKQQLELFLSTHPELQEELHQLRQTRNLLQQAPVPEAVQQLLVVEPGRRNFAQWWQEAKNLFPQTLLGKWSFAMAAGLLLIFFAGSAARLNISFTDAGTSITFGYTPVIQEGLSQQQVQELLQQVQEENATLLADYAQTVTRQNREQLQQVVQYFEQQRYNDLQLIDQNLDQVKQSNTYRWQQTNRFLGEVLQTVSLQNQP
jgi:hypothetical protein